MRTAMAMLVAAAVASAPGGCAGDAGGGTTLRLWAMGREGEVATVLVEGFEREHPGIRVRVQQVPWSAAHEKLLTAYVGNSMPDVFQLGNTWVPELVALRAISPLGDRLAASSAVSAADFFPGIFDTNVIDGEPYALPWYVDTRLLFYRRDLLARAGIDEPPSTWDEWLAAMRAVKEAGGPDAHAVLMPLGEWEPPVILAMQLGSALLRDGGRYGDFESAEFRRAFALYVGLFTEGLAPTTGAAQAADPYRGFAAGEFAFYLTGPWNLGEMRKRLPARLSGAWTTAPMPAPGAPPAPGATQAPGVSLAGGASLAVYRASPRQEEAWALMEYLLAPEQQRMLNERTGDLPGRPSVWESAGLAADERTAAFWSQLRHVRPTPKVPEWERIAARIGLYSESAIRGVLSADEALARLNADADMILAKRRSLLDAERVDGPR